MRLHEPNKVGSIQLLEKYVRTDTLRYTLAAGLVLFFSEQSGSRRNPDWLILETVIPR